MPQGITYVPTIHATKKGSELLTRSSGLLMGRRKWIMLVYASTRKDPPTIVDLFREVRTQRQVAIPEATLARELAELESAGLVRIAR